MFLPWTTAGAVACLEQVARVREFLRVNDELSSGDRSVIADIAHEDKHVLYTDDIRALLADGPDRRHAEATRALLDEYVGDARLQTDPNAAQGGTMDARRLRVDDTPEAGEPLAADRGVGKRLQAVLGGGG
jgi:hypothetical protein